MWFAGLLIGGLVGSLNGVGAGVFGDCGRNHRGKI